MNIYNTISDYGLIILSSYDHIFIKANIIAINKLKRASYRLD